MTHWAHLTWQVPEPAVFARQVAARLGTVAREGGLVPGASTIDLGGVVLEIRPWIRESGDDDPQPGGRLVLEPVSGGELGPEATEAGLPDLELAGIGWATIELDRAEAELEPWVGEGIPAVRDVDDHLGATARVRAGGDLPGERLVLLEPATEGRVAASLARDAEGPCALYLRPAAGLTAWCRDARARGVQLSARRIGPLGVAVLVRGGPVAGPHLLLVDARPATIPMPSAGTIAP